MKGWIEKKLFGISCIVLLLCVVAIESTAGICNQVPGKTSWPELVGHLGKQAAATINKQNALVTALLCSPSISSTPNSGGTNLSCLTKDINCNRVRVFVNARGLVTQTPKVG